MLLLAACGYVFDVAAYGDFLELVAEIASLCNFLGGGCRLLESCLRFFLRRRWRGRDFGGSGLLSVALVLSGGATFFVHATWWDTDDVTTLQAGVAAGTGFDGVDEYDPVGDDHYNLAAKAPQVKLLPAIRIPMRDAAALIRKRRRWRDDFGGAVDGGEKRLRVTALGPVRVALRVLNYPAWRVEVNGARVAPENNGDTAQMVVALPAGRRRSNVAFGRTWDRTVGGV